MPFISDDDTKELIRIGDENTVFELVKLLSEEEVVALFLDPNAGKPSLLHTLVAKAVATKEYDRVIVEAENHIECIYYILLCLQRAAAMPTVMTNEESKEHKEPVKILDAIVNLQYPHKPKRSQNLLYLFASNVHMTPIAWKLLHSLVSQTALDQAWNDNFHEEATGESSFIKEATRCQSPECLELTTD